MERWRTIPGFEIYEVSDLGRIRSIDRFDRKGSHRSARILKHTISGKGYHRVGLYTGPELHNRRDYRVNRLVLLAFVGLPPTPAHHAAHSDDDKGNNKLANLSWKTPIENVIDRWHNGGYPRRSTL